MPMLVGSDTPLEDVLEHIKRPTQGPNDSGIPIYVDPVGLNKAGSAVHSPVQLYLEDSVPLKTSLSLLLKQIGLRYYVTNWLLTIANAPAADALQRIGHCYFTLLAALLGAIAARRVHGRDAEVASE